MQLHTFHPFNPIFIIGLLCDFKLACVIKGMNNGEAIQLFNYFMKKSAAVSLIQLASEHKDQITYSFGWKNTMMTTHPQIVNYLLHTCDTEKILLTHRTNETIFTQPSIKTPS